MKWYALLPLVALASALTTQEQQAHSQYYGSHRRPCGDAQFSVLVADAQNYTLRTTGIPQHAAYRTSPYRAAIQELVYNFPREPVALERPLCVPSGVPIGFALDGVPFYNPLSKDWNNAIEGSCAYVFDRCGGNVDKNYQYYYSDIPNFDQQCLDLNRNQEMVHIGVALDGFPIYYERRFNGSNLDECGGRYLDTTNKRFYRYVVSNQFPYTIGCFRGKVHNISTLTYCKGNRGEYGSLCACVNVGPPGMAVGYKWLSKDAVTVGQCMRRPAVQERERSIICNRDQIPTPDFLEEDRRSKTCVDFRALYSFIVIQGQGGGLAPWTRLKNYGRDEDLDELEEDSEYIRHFKALRWLLNDLEVLDYPEFEKYEKILKNRTKLLCPKEQRKLRNALAQIWVVAFLREAHKLRPDASKYEKEEVDRAYKRLMYVLKTLKALEITAFIKQPDKKAMDPWGIWVTEDEEDDEEEMKKDEDRLAVLVSQLTALQTVGQLKEGELEKNGEKSEGGDSNNKMRARLLRLLWDIQEITGEPKENGGNGEEEENGGEGNGGAGCPCKGNGGEGCRGEGNGGEGCRGEGNGGEGCRGEGNGGEGSRGEGNGGAGCPCKGNGGERCRGEGNGGEGCRGERNGGEGSRGEGNDGAGCPCKGNGDERCRGEGNGGADSRAEGNGGVGCGNGGRKGGEEEDDEQQCGCRKKREEDGDCKGDYEKPKEGMEGMRCGCNGGRVGEGENGEEKPDANGGGGRCNGDREKEPEPRGVPCGRGLPPPRNGGGDGRCPNGAGRDQDPRDMMQDTMEQIQQLISYLRQAGASPKAPPRPAGGREMPGRGEGPEGPEGREGGRG